MPKPILHAPTPQFAIVDDHTAVAEIMGYALQTKIPVKCSARYNSLEAAFVGIPASKPRVVITDWRMGAGTTELLIKQLSKELPETRWLLFTAWPTVSVIRAAVAAGIHGCVSKAADYEELAHGLEELLQNGSYFCPESMKGLGIAVRPQTAGAASLTNTERSILQCVAQGLEPKEISDRVSLSPKTVHNYLVTIRHKLGLASMVDLARFAVHEGIASP